VLGVILLGGAGVYLAKTSSVEGHSESGLHKATAWLDKQWKDFLTPVQFSQTSATRLTTAKGTRSELYRVGLDEFVVDPLIGGGAGSYEPRYIEYNRVGDNVRNAHSLEIETLAELGIVGIALLALLIGAIVAAILRARLVPGGLGRSQSAAVGAAFSVWLLHSAVDWDWQVPAFTGTALVLAACVLPYGRKLRRGAGAERRASAQWPPATVPGEPAGRASGSALSAIAASRRDADQGDSVDPQAP
jgi:O-Antigen ligase